MKKEDMNLWTTLAFPLILSTACLEDEPVVPARVFFVSPAHGDTVTTELIVRLGFTGYAVKPAGVVEEGSGYLNLFIDNPCAVPGEKIVATPHSIPLVGGDQELAIEMIPGRHSLCVQMSDGSGTALPLVDTIQIEVVERTIMITSPRDNDYVGTHVVVDMKAIALVVEPSVAGVNENHGHFTLSVDEECPSDGESVLARPETLNLDKGETSVAIDVQQGLHTLCLGFADGDDRALPYRARIQFFSY